MVSMIDAKLWGYILKVNAYQVLDTHNSTRYDFALLSSLTYTKNDTQYIKDAIYLKNDYTSLLLENGANGTSYIALYEWNTNRKNWLAYNLNSLFN